MCEQGVGVGCTWEVCPATAEPSINVFIFFGFKNNSILSHGVDGHRANVRHSPCSWDLLPLPWASPISPTSGPEDTDAALSFCLKQITGRQRLNRDWLRAHTFDIARAKKMG